MELIVGAGTTGIQTKFQDIPELRSDTDKDALIFSIAVSCAEAVPLTFTGNTNATFAQVQNAFLTLYILGTEEIFQVPLIRFLNIKGNTDAYFNTYELFETQPLRVDWTKSFVQFATPPDNDADFSYLFEFGYDWFPGGTYAQYLKNLNAARLTGTIGY